MLNNNRFQIIYLLQTTIKIFNKKMFLTYSQTLIKLTIINSKTLTYFHKIPLILANKAITT